MAHAESTHHQPTRGRTARANCRAALPLQIPPVPPDAPGETGAALLGRLEEAADDRGG